MKGHSTSVRTRCRAALARQPQRGFLLNPYALAAAGNPTAVAIYNSLVGWWDFEENGAGTQFLDASGHGNHLSIRQGGSSLASSSATTASGKVARGFDVPSNSGQRTAYMPRSNTALDGLNSDHSFGGWFSIANAVSSTARFVMGRLGTGSNGNALISLDGPGNLVVGGFSANGSTFQRVTTGPTPNGALMFIVLSFDRTASQVRLRIKSNDSPTRDFSGSTAFTGTLYTTASTANFCISQALDNDSTFFSGNRDLHGVADACFYRSAITTEDEFLFMFNGGAGMDFAALATAAGH